MNVERPNFNIEGYRITGILGSGGFSTVYSAQQESTDRAVAIKVLSNQLSSDDRERQRFLNEAKVCSTLDHESIARVLSYGHTGEDVPYIVWELLEGKTLADVLLIEGSIPLSRFLELAKQICEALACAHDHGVIHRDIKPANIMIVHGDPEKAVILDFGVARQLPSTGAATQSLTATSAVLGSPHYMAPELFGKSKATVKSDIYALGCLFFHMLTGRPPFDGETAAHIMNQHAASQPPHITVQGNRLPQELDQLIRQMLAKSPDLRPGSVAEVEKILSTLNCDRLLQRRVPWLPLVVASAVLIAVSVFIVQKRSLTDGESSLDSKRVRGTFSLLLDVRAKMLGIAADRSIDLNRADFAVATSDLETVSKREKGRSRESRTYAYIANFEKAELLWRMFSATANNKYGHEAVAAVDAALAGVIRPDGTYPNIGSLLFRLKGMYLYDLEMKKESFECFSKAAELARTAGPDNFRNGDVTEDPRLGLGSASDDEPLALLNWGRCAVYTGEYDLACELMDQVLEWYQKRHLFGRNYYEAIYYKTKALEKSKNYSSVSGLISKWNDDLMMRMKQIEQDPQDLVDSAVFMSSTLSLTNNQDEALNLLLLTKPAFEQRKIEFYNIDIAGHMQQLEKYFENKGQLEKAARIKELLKAAAEYEHYRDRVLKKKTIR